jgi:hypothetical protein
MKTDGGFSERYLDGINNTFEQNETLAPSIVYLLKLFNMLGTYKHNICHKC